jgi:hypothetical protein
MLWLRAVWLATGLAAAATRAVAQFDQPFVTKEPDSRLVALTSESVDPLQFLSQGSLAVTNGSPKVSIQALTYYIGVSEKRMIPFYLATNLPTVSDTTVENVAESLLNEFGGLFNSSVGYYGKLKLGNWFNFSDDQLGLFLDLRGGVRGDDLVGSGVKLDNLAGFGYTVALVKLVLPVFKKKENTTTRSGDVTIGGSLAGLLSLGGNVAPRGFDDEFTGLGYINGTVSVNITDALLVRAGRTLTTTESGLPRRWFVAGSLVPPPKKQ